MSLAQLRRKPYLSLMISKKPTPLFRLLNFTRAHRRQVKLASLYTVINKIFDIAPEILIGMAIDVVVSQEKSFLAKWGVTDSWEQILVLAVITLFIWVGESIFEYLFMINWRGLAQSVQHELRISAYGHIQELDISFFEDQSTGQLTAILNDDINQLERFLDGGAAQLIKTFTAVVGVGAVFFYISPMIASVSFLPIPLIIMGSFYFQKRAQPLYAAVREHVGHLNQRLNNNLSGILTIKSFTAEKREVDEIRRQSEDYMKANKEAIAVSSAFTPIIRMAILMGFLATLMLGAREVFSGNLKVGSYGVLVFLTQRLLWPLTGLAETVDLYERAMASTRRILDLIDTPIEMKPGKKQTSQIKGHFELKNLNFSYSSGPEVLKDICCEILPHKTTAFVGSTGSGKSTLLKLMLRFYDPKSGEILLDGMPLNEFEEKSLRKRVSLVSQDVFLFHGTVRDNLSYGKPEASEEEIKRAIELAEADQFIQRLPEGLDTIIGERGQKLSGGQRQRLSIARAILKDPDLLILDEATSAVDNETEAAIQRSLSIVSKDRTVIIIAHRLSTIVNADRIYVLENGQIADQGSHADLIARPGVYRQLWSVQTGSNL